MFSVQVCSAFGSDSSCVSWNDHFCPPSPTSNYFIFLSVIYCCTTDHTKLSGFKQPCYCSWLFGLGIWAGLGGGSSSLFHIVMVEVAYWGWKIQDGFTHMSGISIRGGRTGWGLAESVLVCLCLSLSLFRPPPSPFIMSHLFHRTSTVRKLDFLRWQLTFKIVKVEDVRLSQSLGLELA